MRNSTYAVIGGLFCAAVAVVFAVCSIGGDVEAWRQKAAGENGKNGPLNTKYTITIDSEITHGTVTANPMSGTRDTEITVSVVPDTGYRLKLGSLKCDNTVIAMTDANTGKFNLPASKVTITAEFEAIPAPTDPNATYRVTIGSTITNGTVTADTASGPQNTLITLTVTPNQDYRLQAGSLKYNGTEIVMIDESTGVFYLPDADVTITAVFEFISVAGAYTVTIDPAITNGSVTANPMSAPQLTQIIVTVTPDAGYRLKEGSLKRGNSLTAMNTTIANNRFNMPARDVYITAEFEQVSGKQDYSKYREELLAIIAEMTLDEKVGQMAQVERGQLTHPNPSNEVKQFYLGSVTSSAGGGPGSGTASGNTSNTSLAQWWTYTNNMLLASMENEPKGNLTHGIPMVYTAYAAHGHADAIQNPTVFPHNIGMGAIAVGDLEIGKQAAYDEGVVTAAEIYATGIRFNLSSPSLGVGENSSWGRMYESYSENPAIVAAMGAHYVQGLQSSGKVGAGGGRYAFEGQVMTSSSITSGNALVDLNSPANRAKIEPYQAAIDAGLLSIRTWYGQVNGNKPVRYKDLLDILKKPKEQGGMGFEGFIITDWADIGTGQNVDLAQDTVYRNNIATSINAGVDMAMLANSRNSWINFIGHVKALVADGTVSMSRINDAVYRILLFKKVFGILDDPIVPQPNPFPNGSAEHRQVARDIAAQTLVLLKNEGDIVGQLKNKTNILLTGEGSAHLGYQCGGWTREWQGISTATIADFVGTNIETGIRNAVGVGVTVVRSANGAIPTNAPAGFTPDVIIAVASETNYTEGTGDVATPGIGGTGRSVAADGTMLNTIHTNYPNVPKVLIVISGRPVSLSTTSGTSPDQVIRDNRALCQGIVAAWLPGSEGGDAIADVLFGNKDFVGKTPFTWRVTPRDGEVVFPYGWGLKKGETATP